MTTLTTQIAAIDKILDGTRQSILTRATTTAAHVESCERAHTQARQELQEAEVRADGHIGDATLLRAQALVQAASSDQARARREAAAAAAAAEQAKGIDLAELHRAVVELADNQGVSPVEIAKTVATAFFGRDDEARGCLRILWDAVTSGDPNLPGDLLTAREAVLSGLRERFALDAPNVEDRCARLETELQKLRAAVTALTARCGGAA